MAGNALNRRSLDKSAWLLLVFLAVWAIAYGGSKGRISFNGERYIRNDGSYYTNDAVHIAIAKVSSLLPDDTDILVYARPMASSNAVDWVRLAPFLTFADHPYNYALPNATNYNILVASSYVPVTVHTNGVWSIPGFIIPETGGKAGFKNTRILIKEDNE